LLSVSSLRAGAKTPSAFEQEAMTLAHMAAYPMINLDASFASGVSVMSTFQAKGHYAECLS